MRARARREVRPQQHELPHAVREACEVQRRDRQPDDLAKVPVHRRCRSDSAVRREGAPGGLPGDLLLSLQSKGLEGNVNLNKYRDTKIELEF